VPYIRAQLKNGVEVGVTDCEVVLPISALKNMTAEEIGETVISLSPYAERLHAYVMLGPEQRAYFESLEDFEQAEALGRIKTPKQQIPQKKPQAGLVYLIRGGGFYKIGLTTDKLPIRHKQIGIKLPFKTEVVHTISTSDTSALEQYWHNHFARKRAEGEWFNLSPEDVMEFCSHKRMEIATSVQPQS
jgi:hypothetical protein